MARSLRAFINDVKIDLRDTAGSQNSWSFDEYYSAFQSAFRLARGFFAVPDVYYSLVLVPGGRAYALPPHIEDIRVIEYAIQGQATTLGTSWWPLRAYRHAPTGSTNYLFVDGDFPNAQTRVYFDRDITVPPVEVTQASLVSSTASFIPIRLAASSVAPVGTTGYPIELWAPLVPFHVQADNEVMRIDSVSVTGFYAGYRGAFNTTPVANSIDTGIGYQHDTPGAITPYIAYNHADEFLFAQAKRELAFYRLNDAESEANRNLAALATEWGQQAGDARRKYNPRKVPRVFTVRIQPRR